MRLAYSFSVLRYIHDPGTQEFINVGIVLFSPDAKYLKAICTTKYGRISGMFQEVDGSSFRQLSRYIENRIQMLGNDYASSLPFDDKCDIEQILLQVLPQDDSAIQFSKSGVGLTSDCDVTLRELYDRYVDRYILAGETTRRTDEEVWRVFRERLDERHVTTCLRPKRIVAPSFEYEFQRSWKNRIWHLYEPVSLDMAEAGSMLDKANKWVGRATSLIDSPEEFRIHLLLGEPHDPRLKATFVKAENILNKMPGHKEIIRESEAIDFAEELAREMKQHP